MQLVVDTNILLSFFRDNPVRFIIVNSDLIGLRLSSPQYSIDELKKNKLDVLKYSKLNSEQFNKVLSELPEFIEIISNELFRQFEAKAKQLTHDKDIPVFAFCVILENRIVLLVLLKKSVPLVFEIIFESWLEKVNTSSEDKSSFANFAIFAISELSTFVMPLSY